MELKLPPQSIECEIGVLGAVLLENNVLEQVYELVNTHEFFYKPEHQIIYKNVLELFHQGRKVDLITVTDCLRANSELESVGGSYGLMQLVNSIVSTAHAIDHAKIVVEKYLLREQIRISNETIKEAYEEVDCFDLKEKTISQLSSLYETNSSSVEHISKAIKRNLEDAYAAANNPDFTLGYSSGLKGLDSLTNGFQNKSLIVLAARPGQGKTSLAGNFLLNLAKSNHAVGFISLEMSKDEITKRLLAAEARIDLNDINHGRIQNFDRLNTIASKIAALPIYFEDKPSISILGIKTLIRRFVSKLGVKIIIIDYLQLIKGVKVFNKNRAEIVSEIARTLKECAKEYNVPIIALAQLNRQVDKQSNKKPVLSDLAESGGIEANADQVIFIYYENGANLVVAKNRGGQIGDVPVKFIPNLQKWTDANDSDYSNVSGFMPSSVIQEKPKFEDEPF